MGIPKFYRWLSERFPLINQPGGATVVPIIDNFYLDMNGIIHNCTHGNNHEVKLTEDEMIVKIFLYLDKLFHIVKPQKVIFMAIDGVAPRAKMNQQRSRRFRHAKEAEEAARAAEKRGEPVDEDRFDSNCITPGTPFMARLGAHLRFFIRKKISEDPVWQKPTIIFSGHEVPGEGEHKIMEYIRWAKKVPGYAPNTRHCLYGLDADLIMLSLVTHEPHFCLLREVVSYTSGSRGQPAREVLENPCQEHFVLFQIGLLRDYLEIEFKSVGDTLPFAYDLERIVDDFVLFCMLVGNDFLPPLPTVDISEGSLDTMFELYKELLPKLGGYLTYAGDLHRDRLEVFMKALADQEADVLEARAQDTEEYESKKASRVSKRHTPAWANAALERVPPGSSEEDGEEDVSASFDLDLAKLALQSEGHELELLALEEGEEDVVAELITHGGGEEEEKKAQQQGPTMMSEEARNFFLNGDKFEALAAWRNRYYREKLRVKDHTRREVLEAFIQGLHWVLEYYYRGVASWNWFYPYHYAPMASDFTSLNSVKVGFMLGQPFHPFEQLLAVQPSSSCKLLPEPYRWLMTDPHSPIADFYPVEFEVDFEGKRSEWEGVALIPFIDEKRLLAASRSVPAGQLTQEERDRNKLGDIMVFTYCVGSKENSFCATTLPSHYSSVAVSNSLAMVQAAPPPLPAGEKGFMPTTVAGTKVGASGPAGFPTLRTLSVTAELIKAGINVFGSPSRKSSLILTVKDLPSGPGAPTAAQVAHAVVGQRAWVKWPYLQEALVVAVSDGKSRCGMGDSRPMTSIEVNEWDRQVAALTSEYKFKQGLDVGHIRLVLHIRPCEGLTRQIDGTLEKRFGKTEILYPLQVTLRRNPSPDPRFQSDAKDAAGRSLLDEQQPLYAGDVVMFLGRAHYGCRAILLPSGPRGLDKKGKVIGATSDSNSNSNRVPLIAPYRVHVFPAPASSAQTGHAARRILTNVTVSYAPSHQVARKMGVSARTLGRMTGNVWVNTGDERRDRIDIGLCVKNGAKGLYVPDYCVPMEAQNQLDNNNNNNNNNNNKRFMGWAYSDAMIRTLEQYKQRFGWVWAAIEREEKASSSQSLASHNSSVGSGMGNFISSQGPPRALTMEDLLPGMDEDQALAQVSILRKWLASTPLGKRPLVKPTAQVAPESAIRMLQSAMPPNPKELDPVELENVAPGLILPPIMRGGTQSVLAGGTFEIADRVTVIGSSSAPVFGSRGTVVGIYDDAIEVLFDKEFLGGSDLFGRCNGNCGALLPRDQLLNLSRPHAVKAEGAEAPRTVTKRNIVGAVPNKQKAVEMDAGAWADGKKAGGVTAAQALAAASAALRDAATAPKPPSMNDTSNEKGKQLPRIPDENGAKGFSAGRGRPLAQPSLLPPSAIHAAPGSAASNPGALLLAQLNSGGGGSNIRVDESQSNPVGSPMIPLMPPHMPPPPPPHMIPGYHHPTMMHDPIPMPGASLHVDTFTVDANASNQGAVLLSQLQQRASTNGQVIHNTAVPPMPPIAVGEQEKINPGQALLGQLKAQKVNDAGSMLLQQLQQRGDGNEKSKAESEADAFWDSMTSHAPTKVKSGESTKKGKHRQKK